MWKKCQKALVMDYPEEIKTSRVKGFNLGLGLGLLGRRDGLGFEMGFEVEKGRGVPLFKVEMGEK